MNPEPGDHATPNRETDLCQEENSDNHPEKNKQGEEILSAIGNLAEQMRKEMRFIAEKMSTEMQSLKGDILTKCSELEEKCDALAPKKQQKNTTKNTSLEDTVFNNEACLGEVEEAKAASDMKFDSLASEIESLKKEFDRLEGFSGRSDSRSMVQKVEKFVWNKDKEILFVNELNSAEMQNTLQQAFFRFPIT